MERILKEAYNPDFFRKEGHKLIDMMADYLQECLSQKEIKVLPWKNPDDQYNDWKIFFQKKSNVQKIYKKFLNQSIHLHHPKYIGHQVTSPAPINALTELLTSFLNNGMAIYEMGPAASAIERNVIEWLLQFIGWDEHSSGLMTSGGSLGNLTALLVARQALKKHDIWKDGVQNNLVIMASSESHYSIERSAKILGLGEHGLIKLPVDKHLKINVDKLPKILKKNINNGKDLIALVSNACSTSTGIYDSIDEIADFCQENNIWMHIDAAHGAPAIFSSKYKHLTKGIERADSVVIDFHKMMLVPALTSAVLFKNGKTSYQAFTQKASYLLNKKGEIPWYDVAGRTIECTKQSMGLKVYLMLKLYGNKLFTSYIDTTYSLALEFSEYIKSLEDFELFCKPESNIVCFRLFVNNCDTNKLNSSIREKIKNDGEFYIVQTIINNQVYFRITIMNPFTTMDVLKALIEKIRKYKKLFFKNLHQS